MDISLSTIVLLGAWLLMMISVPILRWIWGERGLTVGITAGVLLQAAAVVAILASAWGAAATLRTVALVMALAWIAEFIGAHTGFPFGRYAYTERLQPQLGHVPLLIPMAWVMMLPPAWAVSAAWSSSAMAAHTTPAGFALAAGLAFTAWDLFLDPQMIGWQLWRWSDSRQGPRYFGIPWINFAGWFAVSALITWLVLLPGPSPLGPATLPLAPLLLVYGLTWALESFGQLVFWGLPGPALSGGTAMGLCLLWALNRDLAASLITPLVWTGLAFLCGALPFSLWVAKVALKTDIRRYGDGNPGATNVLRAGGKGLALLAAFLDMFKGALPVALAYVVLEMRGWEIVPIALAPVVGHMVSPFLKGRGGKGVAVTGGIWIGLTYGIGAAIGAATMTLATLAQTVSGWSVVLGMLAIGVYLAAWRPDPVLLAVWAGNALLILWRHREDLRQQPRWRHRAREESPPDEEGAPPNS